MRICAGGIYADKRLEPALEVYHLSHPLQQWTQALLRSVECSQDTNVQRLSPSWRQVHLRLHNPKMYAETVACAP